jgi:hypothetical protein
MVVRSNQFPQKDIQEAPGYPQMYKQVTRLILYYIDRRQITSLTIVRTYSGANYGSDCYHEWHVSSKDTNKEASLQGGTIK